LPAIVVSGSARRLSASIRGDADARLRSERSIRTLTTRKTSWSATTRLSRSTVSSKLSPGMPQGGASPLARWKLTAMTIPAREAAAVATKVTTRPLADRRSEAMSQTSAPVISATPASSSVISIR